MYTDSNVDAAKAALARMMPECRDRTTIENAIKLLCDKVYTLEEMCKQYEKTVKWNKDRLGGLESQLSSVRSRAKAMDNIAAYYKNQVRGFMTASKMKGEVNPAIKAERVYWWMDDIIRGDDAHLPQVFCRRDMSRDCVCCDMCEGE